MMKFALVSLAALAAALPSAAAAQPGPAGHSWGQPRGHTVVAHAGGAHQRRSPHFRRIERGFVVPNFWWGPQFHVQHWQMYGFPQPTSGHRWIRYYDDALLIDRRGRVRDGRYGFDWDRYGDRWSQDERGIPMYAGDGDFHPGPRDYDRAHGRPRDHGRADRRPHHGGGDWDYSEYGGDGGPPECAGPSPCGPPQGYGAGCGGPPPCGAPAGYGYQAQGYGYGHGYGYGYGYGAATVTIVETTVTTGGGEIVEEIVEEVYEEERARRVHRRPPPRRPIRGERG